MAAWSQFTQVWDGRIAVMIALAQQTVQNISFTALLGHGVLDPNPQFLACCCQAISHLQMVGS